MSTWNPPKGDYYSGPSQPRAVEVPLGNRNGDWALGAGAPLETTWETVVPVEYQLGDWVISGDPGPDKSEAIPSMVHRAWTNLWYDNSRGLEYFWLGRAGAGK